MSARGGEAVSFFLFSLFSLLSVLMSCVVCRFPLQSISFHSRCFVLYLPFNADVPTGTGCCVPLNFWCCLSLTFPLPFEFS